MNPSVLCARAFGGDALPLFVEFAETFLRLFVVFVETREACVVARRLGLRQLFAELREPALCGSDVVFDRLRVAPPALLLLRVLPAALLLRAGLRRVRRPLLDARGRLDLYRPLARGLGGAALGLPVVVLGVVAVVMLRAAHAVEREDLRGDAVEE